jgi:hypothetical protein
MYECWLLIRWQLKREVVCGHVTPYDVSVSAIRRHMTHVTLSHSAGRSVRGSFSFRVATGPPTRPCSSSALLGSPTRNNLRFAFSLSQ